MAEPRFSPAFAKRSRIAVEIEHTREVCCITAVCFTDEVAGVRGTILPSIVFGTGIHYGKSLSYPHFKRRRHYCRRFITRN